MNGTDQQLETLYAKELRDEIARLGSWIRAANQFAWAHEKNCPGYESGGAHCTCGLDQFLSRPRPFIESYKSKLDAANQRIAELDHSYHAERAKVNTANYRIAELEISNRDGQRLINELNGQLADSERAKEAAERKLAAARHQHFAEFLDFTCKLNRWIDRTRMEQALAQTEQPQNTCTV